MKQIFLAFLFTLFLSSCIPGNQTTTQQPTDVAPLEQQQSGESSQIAPTDDIGEPIPEATFIATEDGQTAFELLQENAEVEYEEYDFGVFIQGINGTVADAEHYWALYVNDEYSQTGADQTELQAGDVVTFRYEQINE